jgi:MYXO-CTERM domain-containing protein
MHLSKSFLLAIPLAALALSPARDAKACGGCFHEPGIQQMDMTQVTGHRMIFSISKTQTTLWDQITYMGDPKSFAWVLPIKGMADIGVSSDALFGNLEQETQIVINSPFISCPSPPQCNSAGFAAGAGGGGMNEDGGVTVTAQKVVGPYDTVQLSSSDPAALTNWLTQHNYKVPPDIDPIIAAYVKEGFDFVAIKLVPNMGISSMKPIRVTTMGATPTLPLRMVAAGVGATTPITLWILSESAYKPSNFGSFEITDDDLVWDWTSMSSNYADLKSKAFAAGKGWLIEAGEPFTPYLLQGNLTSLAMYDPMNSGYADDMGMGAPAAAAADLATLFAGIDPASTWITRLHAELPRAALATDLAVGAWATQTPVSRNLTAKKTTGTPPMCPTYPPCGTGGAGGGGGAGGSGGAGASANNLGPDGVHAGSFCAIGNGQRDKALLATALLALGLAAARRRRR